MGYFIKALPVWAEGYEQEMNITCGFRALVPKQDGDDITLRMTGSCSYHVFINGKPFQFGPVRCGHGFYRVDVWNITDQLGFAKNTVAIEVQSSNINSFYALDQPPFIQAEICRNGEVAAYTGAAAETFEAFLLHDRVQRVQRYSFQRAFAEAYHLRNTYARWRVGGDDEQPVTLAKTGLKTAIDRELPPFVMQPVYPDYLLAEGTVCEGVKPKEYWRHRSLINISDKLKGFHEEELELCQSKELDELAYACDSHKIIAYLPSRELTVKQGRYCMLSMEREKTGFLCLHIRCETPARFYVVYDEILSGGDIDPLRLESVASIRFELEAGDNRFQSADPIGFRYLKLFAFDGDCCVSDIHLREFAFSMPIINKYTGNDAQLRRIFDAAVETFRQNASDIYMDCPTRERGGWLCDSFFLGRAEYALTNASRIERVFLQNFVLPESFDNIPEGMLPMCYPADHYDHMFIPNWAMWFVLELSEYVRRSGDCALGEQAKDRVYALLDYFNSFLNEYGLLEKLDSWIFVEWSKANELVQDVNYPTNMLYAAMLTAAGELYQDNTLIRQGEDVRGTIRKRSFDGEFFVDNEVRVNGGLQPTGERTETCQYYAFFFDTATPETHSGLWDVLRENFGPDRESGGLYPEIYPSNALGGNCMRLYLLNRYGEEAKMKKEIQQFCGYMADATGTLWEHVTDLASCNHGFSSYIADLILKST